MFDSNYGSDSSSVSDVFYDSDSVSYLLVLLAITATILPRKYVNAFALASIVVYTSFLILDLRVEQELMLEGTGHNMQQHLVGMWAIFLVSAIAYFTLVVIGASLITAVLCIVFGLLGRWVISKYKN